MDLGALDFLTNQPVDGELLTDVLARGRLPGEEALRYAIDIGKALSRAHARGLVHGSVSPYAIAITSSGARLLKPPDPMERRSAPYSSPEQVRGAGPDQRSDVFSYGAVMYEMASGKRPFPGTGAELDRQILESPPPLFNDKTKFHIAMEGAIAGCLAKDPAARRQRIQNVVTDLRLSAPKPGSQAAAPRPKSSTGAAPPAADPSRKVVVSVTPLPSRPKDGSPWPPRARRPSPRRPMSLLLGLGLIALVMITVAGMAAAVLSFLRPRPPAQVVNFRVPPPDRTSYPGPPSISPDGRLLAFSATGPDGIRMLWLRPLDDVRMTPIPGTEGAAAPFWSPDSRLIGFFSNQSLRKVPSAGGPVSTIGVSEPLAGGGTWNSDGTILFASGLSGGIFRVPADGGTPVPILNLNSTKSERAFLWPQFLPDNQHFIFFVLTDFAETTGVYESNLESPASYHILLASESNAIYSSLGDSGSRKHGYLLYMQGRSLVAHEFNAASRTLEGEPFRVIDEIGSLRSLLLAPVSVSNNGTLAYQPVGEATRQLVWLNRAGKQTAMVKDTGDWGPPRISPDGTRIVAAKLAADGHTGLWFVDANGNATQLPSTGAHEGSPIWSPDGSRLAFISSNQAEGSYDVFVKPAIGGRPELVYKSAVPKYLTDWSRDGRYILFTAVPSNAKADVWGISTIDRHAGPILNTIYAEGYASLSPDGKWIAFQSDESGGVEVYVQPFDGVNPGTKRRWQVSKGGGGMPRWRGDGKELFFVTYSGKMMSVAVNPSGPSFEFEAPRMLYQTRPYPKTWNLYDVSPDGQRFAMNLSFEMTSSATITVLTNWTEKLRRLASN